MELTKDSLCKLLNYNKNSGKLYWNYRSRGMFKRHCDYVDWNKKWANKEAGSLSDKGYVKIKIGNKSYFAHRLVWLMVYGEYPLQVDHINRDKKDNRLSNLQNSNPKHNTRNKGKYKNNSSGVTGVCWHNRDKLWVVRGVDNGKRFEIGRSKDYNVAVKLRDNWLISSDFRDNHGA